jgi:hypothetical protein
MTQEVTSIAYEGNANFKAWLEQAEALIKKWGKANVYFYATGCGLSSYGVSRRRLLTFLWVHPQYVFVEDQEALKRGSCIAKNMALKRVVRDAKMIEASFKEICDAKNNLRASCGCSIFISDAQEIRIMLLHPNYTISMEV